MTINIKQLAPTDTRYAQELILLWSKDDHDVEPQIPSKTYLKTQLTKGSFHVYVALDDDQVVGGLTAYELNMFDKEVTEMFLYEIGVTANYRRQGIAKKLIDALKKTCYQNNIPIIFVGTSLDNEAAKLLYETTGGDLEITPWYTYELKNP